jgi:hypothetical protein
MRLYGPRVCVSECIRITAHNVDLRIHRYRCIAYLYSSMADLRHLTRLLRPLKPHVPSYRAMGSYHHTCSG